MPIVTVAPVAIDLAHFADYPDIFDPDGCPCGPFKIAGALSGPWYIVQQYFPGASPDPSSDTPIIAVYSGASETGPWIFKAASATVQGGVWSAYYPGTGTDIFIVGIDATSGTRHFLSQTFHAASDTFATVSSASPTAFTFHPNSCKLVVLSNGDQYVYYDSPTSASIDKVVYFSLITGVWSSKTTVYTSSSFNATNTPVWDVVVDATDVMHVTFGWWRNGAGDISDLIYIQVSALGVVGSPDTIVSGLFSTQTEPNVSGMHQMAIVGGKLFVPFARLFSVNGFWQICVMVSDGLIAPTWTLRVIYDPISPPIAGDLPYGMFLATEDKNGNPTVFWSIRPSSGSPPYTGTIWLSTSSDGGTTWAAPTLYFDNVVTPITSQDTNRILNGYVGIQESNGTWHLSTCFELTGRDYTVTFAMAGGGVPDITLVFDLIGGAPTGVGALVAVNPSGPGPGPILTPTECVNQQ